MRLLPAALGAMAVGGAAARTVHSVLVFTRHGDRTAKFYPDYQMTNLGAQQVYSSGTFYRKRYIEDGAPHQIAGISPDRVVPSQIWASAPDQAVLYQTATNLLQGLYPPLGQLNVNLATETLVNGTNVEDPLNGYQYILVHGEGETDPDTIWIKGDDYCPAYEKASESYSKSDSYQATLESSSPVYSSVQPLLAPIMGADEVSYSNAYDVFDLLNVASIHNASVANKIPSSTLDQLRYYANEWEWNHNFNASQPDRSIGGMTLSGGILQQLQMSVDAQAETNKFTLLAGSYDTFLAFFGLTNVTSQSEDFYGLPNYAASMVFELYSDGEEFPSDPRTDLHVRWLFRNGTEDGEALNAWPLFGGNSISMPYGHFVDELSSRSINSVGEWCKTCKSHQEFCTTPRTPAEPGATAGGPGAGGHGVPSTPLIPPGPRGFSSGSGLSLAAAGGIGAGVTLAVCGLFVGIIWLSMRRRRPGNHALPPATAEKRLSDSDSAGSFGRV